MLCNTSQILLPHLRRARTSWPQPHESDYRLQNNSTYANLFLVNIPSVGSLFHECEVKNELPHSPCVHGQCHAAAGISARSPGSPHNTNTHVQTPGDPPLLSFTYSTCLASEEKSRSLDNQLPARTCIRLAEFVAPTPELGSTGYDKHVHPA